MKAPIGLFLGQSRGTIRVLYGYSTGTLRVLYGALRVLSELFHAVHVVLYGHAIGVLQGVLGGAKGVLGRYSRGNQAVLRVL